MGKFAARVSDLAGHGGPIIMGEPTVIIGGMMAARKGDPFLCPMSDGPKPHIGGKISSGSYSVLIGGIPAARFGDLTGCGLIGPNVPNIIGPGPFGLGELYTKTDSKINDFEHKLDGDYGFGRQGDGKILIGAKLEGEAKYTALGGDAEFGWGGKEDQNKDNPWAKAKVSGKLGYAEAGGKLFAGVYDEKTGSIGANAKANAEIGVAHAEAGVVLGPKGAGGENPFGSISLKGEGDIAKAKAEGQAMVGSDGEKYGFILKGEATAEAASVAGQGTLSSPTIFGNNIEVSGGVGGSAGSVGVGAGAWLYWNHKTKRLEIGAKGKLAAILGAEGNFNISVGLFSEKKQGKDEETLMKGKKDENFDIFDKKKPEIKGLELKAGLTKVKPTVPSVPSGGIPGTVMTGFSTVLIGG